MDKENYKNEQGELNKAGFLTTLLQGLIRDTVGMWITFLIGTGVGAVLCLYFGLPLIFSLLGGVLVLAVYIAWDRL